MNHKGVGLFLCGNHDFGNETCCEIFQHDHNQCSRSYYIHRRRGAIGLDR